MNAISLLPETGGIKRNVLSEAYFECWLSPSVMDKTPSATILHRELFSMNYPTVLELAVFSWFVADINPVSIKAHSHTSNYYFLQLTFFVLKVYCVFYTYWNNTLGLMKVTLFCSKCMITELVSIRKTHVLRLISSWILAVMLRWIEITLTFMWSSTHTIYICVCIILVHQHSLFKGPSDIFLNVNKSHGITTNELIQLTSIVAGVAKAWHTVPYSSVPETSNVVQ